VTARILQNQRDRHQELTSMAALTAMSFSRVLLDALSVLSARAAVVQNNDPHESSGRSLGAARASVTNTQNATLTEIKFVYLMFILG